MVPRLAGCQVHLRLTLNLTHAGLVGNEHRVLLDIFEVAEGNYQNSEILLSACSTSSSYSADQDSFSGFVKAFTLAGANSILATSWPIDSLSTSEFITSYLKKVNESKNYSTALNRTQREFIDSSSYSHPFFWAPFSVYSSR